MLKESELGGHITDIHKQIIPCLTQFLVPYGENQRVPAYVPNAILRDPKLLHYIKTGKDMRALFANPDEYDPEFNNEHTPAAYVGILYPYLDTKSIPMNNHQSAICGPGSKGVITKTIWIAHVPVMDTY